MSDPHTATNSNGQYGNVQYSTTIDTDFHTASSSEVQYTNTPNSTYQGVQVGSLYQTFQPPSRRNHGQGQDGFFGPNGSWVWGDGAYLTPPLTEAEKKSVRDEYLKSLLAQIAHLEEEVTRIRQDKARDVAEALGELRIVMDELDES